MSLYIINIHGDIEGDYEIVRKYEEQEPVLDKVRAEIRKKMKFNSFNEGYVLYNDITEVFDKYKADRNEENGNDD